MRVASAIAGRELRAYFLTPGGYVVAALFTLLNGLLFVRLVLATWPRCGRSSASA
jgi:hypothetical protein